MRFACLTPAFRFLGSFFVVSITAVAAASPHQPAEFVFATFVNETGWDNPFVVFMNGLFHQSLSHERSVADL